MVMSIDIQAFENLFPDVVRHCDKGELDALLAAASSQEIPAGEVVIREGDVSGDLYFVVKGRLTSTLQGDNEFIEVGEVLAGDSFCKGSLLDPGPAIMTVTANEDSELLMLSHNAFRELEKEYLSMTGNLLRMLSDELIELCRNADRMLFNRSAGLADDEPDRNKGSSMREWAVSTFRGLFGEQEGKS